MNSKKDSLKCGFCGKTKEEAAVFESKLSDSSICIRCVLVCNSLIINNLEFPPKGKADKQDSEDSGRMEKTGDRN